MFLSSFELKPGILRLEVGRNKVTEAGAIVRLPSSDSAEAALPRGVKSQCSCGSPKAWRRLPTLPACHRRLLLPLHSAHSRCPLLCPRDAEPSLLRCYHAVRPCTSPPTSAHLIPFPPCFSSCHVGVLPCAAVSSHCSCPQTGGFGPVCCGISSAYSSSWPLGDASELFHEWGNRCIQGMLGSEIATPRLPRKNYFRAWFLRILHLLLCQELLLYFLVPFLCCPFIH